MTDDIIDKVLQAYIGNGVNPSKWSNEKRKLKYWNYEDMLGFGDYVMERMEKGDICMGCGGFKNQVGTYCWDCQFGSSETAKA